MGEPGAPHPVTGTLSTPDWAGLLEVAGRQGSFFSTDQAHRCGFSNQLLRHHLMVGRIVRISRRIYRATELEVRHPRLYQAWLAARREGCFSHGTALWLHGLRPELEEPYDLTLPPSWRPRARGLPTWVRPHFRELRPEEREFLEGVAATTADRALRDAGGEGEEAP